MSEPSLVLVVSPDCTLCDRARALLDRLRIPYRELDIADDEAGDLARRGVPVVFFPVLVDGVRIVAYGDISEAELQQALASWSAA